MLRRLPWPGCCCPSCWWLLYRCLPRPHPLTASWPRSRPSIYSQYHQRQPSNRPLSGHPPGDTAITAKQKEKEKKGSKRKTKGSCSERVLLCCAMAIFAKGLSERQQCGLILNLALSHTHTHYVMYSSTGVCACVLKCSCSRQLNRFKRMRTEKRCHVWGKRKIISRRKNQIWSVSFICSPISNSYQISCNAFCLDLFLFIVMPWVVSQMFFFWCLWWPWQSMHLCHFCAFRI